MPENLLEAVKDDADVKSKLVEMYSISMGLARRIEKCVGPYVLFVCGSLDSIFCRLIMSAGRAKSPEAVQILGVLIDSLLRSAQDNGAGADYLNQGLGLMGYPQGESGFNRELEELDYEKVITAMLLFLPRLVVNYVRSASEPDSVEET